MKRVQIKKNIKSNKLANEQLSKNFSELAQSNITISEENFKDIYQDLFYKISKKGGNSHTTLIDQSYEYVYKSHDKRLDRRVKNLLKKLGAKESELAFLENPLTNEHPIYENNSILMAGENGLPFQDMTTKYIMQEGRKRAFDNDEVFNITKKALGLSLDDNDGRFFISLNELNSIENGPIITTTTDLNIKGTDLIVDLPDVLGSSAYVDVEFECLGNEISDYVGALTNNLLDLNINTLQFYTGNESCVIKYIQDDYVNDEIGPSIIEQSISKGEKKVIRLLRRTELSNNMIPENINNYYEDNIPINIQYNNTEITNYERNWGPYGDYESVVYAEGRIMSQEVENPSIANYLLSLGETQNTDYRLFNGLPSQTTGIWGESDIVVITDPTYTGQEKSIYNTKMIYNAPGTYGSLNQDEDLQIKVFDDPGNIYYKPFFYGQPILRYNNTYCVIRKAYMGGFATRKAIFVDLITGDEFKKTRTQIRDAMNFEMDKDVDPYDMKWDTLNKDRISYIGLQEVKTLLQPVDDNIFNGIDGSNFELNPYNTL
tara:strand:+ start:2223 stop:3857 length:1635 start_codon:yes stop_codon:yes gene_type:complete